MKFDIVLIVTQLASRIVGEVDANRSEYLETDFTDSLQQEQIIQRELEWLLDYKVVEPQYDQLVRIIVEHPEMQFCFTVADSMVKNQMEEFLSAEKEEFVAQYEYRRDVL